MTEPMTDQQLDGWRWLCEHASPQKSLDRTTVGELASLLARLDAAESRIAQARTAEAAAVRTLEHLGYSYSDGAELWKPPLGTQPDFDLIAQARMEAYEDAAKMCEALVDRPAEYGGRFGGYGGFKSPLTGPECAKRLRERATVK